MEDAYYLSLKIMAKVLEQRGVNGECSSEAKIKES